MAERARQAWVPLGDPIAGHDGPITDLAFSPDGSLLATCGADETIRFWSASTGAPWGDPLRGHTGAVTALAFTRTGKVIASAGNDGSVRLWDVADRMPMGKPIFGHEGRVWDIAFSPDGQVLATAGQDSTIRIWHLGEEPYSDDPLSGHSGPVRAVAFGPDMRLASGGEDGKILFWHPSAGVVIAEPRVAVGSVSWLAFDPRGRRLIIVGDDGVGFWEETADPPAVLLPAIVGAHAAALDASGSLLATASGDEVSFFNPITRRVEDELLLEHPGDVDDIALSLDGRTLATTDDNGTILFWAQGEQLRPRVLHGHLASVTGVAFSPDGRSLASASLDQTVRLWDTVTRTLLGEPLAGHRDGVWAVAFSPDGRILASTATDGAIWLWDTATRTLLGEPLTGHTDAATGVAFSPDGRTLATTSQDQTLRLWDIATRRALGEPLTGHASATDGLAFSPDGRILASTATDGAIWLWDTATRTLLGQPLTGHTDVAISVAFSPDGRTLATTSRDQTLRLWDTATRTPLGQPLTDHRGRIWDVAFDPDGRTLATTNDDGTVQLWDIARGTPLGDALIGHSGHVWEVAFSPDGRTLATAGGDRTVRLWDLPLPEVLYLDSVAADEASTVDLLGFDREARGLARILAARATKPPLAFALLGDWGSGKSTFLNRLEAQIDELTGEAKEHVAAARWLAASPYCAGIRQIRFNAWHYAEDRLWIGLIRKLLGDLATEPDVADAEAVRIEQRRQELDERIASTDQALRRARMARWARRVAVWLLRDARVVDDLARAARAGITAYRRRRFGALALGGIGVVALAAAGLLAGDQMWQVPAAVGAVVFVGATWVTRTTRVVAALVGEPPQETAALEAHRDVLQRKRDELAQNSDPEVRLTRFLQDRQHAVAYDPYRGLVSLVHDDLCTLADLVTRQAEAWSTNPDPGRMPLERVILYIDDLDRCDPAAVVDALRAIHLFLTLRIFHVVVAVDARWLLRCLRHHYDTLLDDDALASKAEGPTDDDDALDPTASTPIDYLEKIFQIAFEVPPMRDQVDGLIAELMPLRASDPDADATATAGTSGNGAAPPNQPHAPTGGDATREPDPAPEGTAQGTPTPDVAPTASPDADVGGVQAGAAPTAVVAETPAADLAEPVGDSPADAEPPTITLPADQRALEFAAAEVAAVKAVAGLLDTPRTLKQLVNVYRVLRATADAERPVWRATPRTSCCCSRSCTGTRSPHRRSSS